MPNNFKKTILPEVDSFLEYAGWGPRASHLVMSYTISAPAAPL